MWRGREAFSKKLHLSNFLKDEPGVEFEQKGKGRPLCAIIPQSSLCRTLAPWGANKCYGKRRGSVSLRNVGYVTFNNLLPLQDFSEPFISYTM